jgi:ABC-type transport system involved in cytochrome bd biosynthesis fused ATPase/permease subunit
VRALPDGLETVLGASGVGLSGGESRRLCCARALLGEAPILIIDEPFAGLDPGTAGRLARVLETRREGRIVIVITHQLEHLGSVQRIYALEDGKIHKVVHTPSAEERAS